MLDDVGGMFSPLRDAEVGSWTRGSQLGPDDWRPLPAPSDTFPNRRHGEYGMPVKWWPYYNEVGELEGYQCRFEVAGEKSFRPLRYGQWTNGDARAQTGWQWRGWEGSRPLYRLRELFAQPDALVIVTEGEKCADAAQMLLPGAVAVTPMNGAHSPAKSDWSPLGGRRVAISLDNDDAGRSFGRAVAELAREAGATEILLFRSHLLGHWVFRDGVRVDRAEPLPEGWDIADALAEGWSAEAIADAFALEQLFESYPWNESTETEATSPDATCSPRFRMAEDGLWCDELNGQSTRLSDRFEVLAETRDGQGSSWGLLLRWHDHDGREHEWAMPRALLAGDSTDVRRTLMDRGLAIAADRWSRDRLAEYLSSVQVQTRARTVSRIGWHGPAFILPDWTFGAVAGERILLQGSAGLDHAFSTMGTLEGWQQHVARLAAGNSRLVLAVSMAFAAPLMRLTGSESGGVHLRGASSIGKSTALLVAGSVWGGGKSKGYVRQWRATDNGLEAIAAAHCDALLVLDELSQVDPKAASTAAYMLANGTGKMRAGRAGESRPISDWRLLFLSSGEIGLAEKMSEDHAARRFTAGQEVRVVDLPADPGAGHGLFETLHDFPSGDALSRELKYRANEHYGTAIRAFIAEVVASADIANRITGHREAFVERNAGGAVDGQVKRVAARFGAIAAAGELATALGIVPWKEGEAAAAAARCFEDWLKTRGGTGPSELGRGVAAVRRFIQLHGSSRFQPSDDPDHAVANRAGFGKKTAEGEDYLIFPEVFHDEVCKGFDAGAIARELDRLGLLVAENNGKVQKTHRVKELAPRRYYHIKGAILDGGENE